MSSEAAAVSPFGGPERQLRKVATELKRSREQVAVIEAQLHQLQGDADAAETRAVVSDDGNAAREARQARRHADNALQRRDELVAKIAQLEVRQDELLDAMG